MTHTRFRNSLSMLNVKRVSYIVAREPRIQRNNYKHTDNVINRKVICETRSPPPETVTTEVHQLAERVFCSIKNSCGECL